MDRYIAPHEWFLSDYYQAFIVYARSVEESKSKLKIIMDTMLGVECSYHYSFKWDYVNETGLVQ